MTTFFACYSFFKKLFKQELSVYSYLGGSLKRNVSIIVISAIGYLFQGQQYSHCCDKEKKM